MLYLDSSAIVKLVLTEPASSALELYRAEHDEHVSSGLARVEVLRALRRTRDDPEALHYAERILARIALIPVNEQVLANAAALDPKQLRSLDAIHLATALSLDGLEAFVAYDRRLLAAANNAGLPTASPGQA